MNRFRLRWIVAGLVGALLIVSAGAAQAAMVYWDTITGDTLAFGAAGSIAANTNATISSVIAGSVAIAKTGAGTVNRRLTGH